MRGYDDDLFVVSDRRDGTISLADETEFDHEGKSSYKLRLKVTDEYGGSDTLEIVIKVEDVQEAPVVPDPCPRIELSGDQEQ